MIDGERRLAATAFDGVSIAGVLYEDPAHGLGGCAEEVAAALPGVGLAFQKADVGFMNEGGGLKSVTGAFAGHLSAGGLAEFVVDERPELGGGLRVAVADGGEEFGGL